MTQLKRLIRTSRPRFWLYLAGPVLVGFVFGADQPDGLVTPLVIATFLYFLIPANLYLYGINDIFDADIDHLNPKKAGPERRFQGDPVVVIAVLASLLLGLILLVAAPLTAGVWYLGFLLLATAYSLPPIHLKRRPFLDSISNGLYILPGVGAYVSVTGVLPPIEIIAGAWLWTMAMHTFSAIPDIEPDRTGGIETTATFLGRNRTLIYCFAVWSAAALSFVLVDVQAGLLLSIYPVLVVTVHLMGVAITRAYWWYPWINATVGMVFTIFGLWGLLYG